MTRGHNWRVLLQSVPQNFNHSSYGQIKFSRLVKIQNGKIVKMSHYRGPPRMLTPPPPQINYKV